MFCFFCFFETQTWAGLGSLVGLIDDQWSTESTVSFVLSCLLHLENSFLKGLTF